MVSRSEIVRRPTNPSLFAIFESNLVWDGPATRDRGGTTSVSSDLLPHRGGLDGADPSQGCYRVAYRITFDFTVLFTVCDCEFRGDSVPFSRV